MPIPVSATGFASAAGAQEAQQAELATSGPFARLAATPAAEPCAAVPQAAASASAPSAAVEVRNLSFWYSGLDGKPLDDCPPVVSEASFSVAPRDRVLLLGANGAGKSTLLRVLAGKHLVPRESVQLCGGASPFHDTWLTVDGALAYIGGTWQKEVAFAGYSVPLQGDFAAGKMLDAVPCSAERRAAIYTALDVDPTWRMHKVSDGQRRRVQLAYGLLRPYQVLLLDEVTVDLDVLGRAQLMDFVRDDCDARGAVVIYVTHIFCGLGGWATHYAFLEDGRVHMLPAAQALKPGQSLLTMVEQWLRAGKARLAGSQAPALHCGAAVVRNNGWAAGRLMPTRAPDVRGDESANLGTA